MRVGVYRYFEKSHRTAKKPLAVFHSTNLDTAEIHFNREYRRKYPENFNFEYVNLDMHCGMLREFNLI